MRSRPRRTLNFVIYFKLIFCCLVCHISGVLYIYIRLKIKPNSVRIIFLSCQICVLPSTGFELTPLIHCSTIRLALRPAPKTTRPHPLPIYIYVINYSRNASCALNYMYIYIYMQMHYASLDFISEHIRYSIMPL